MRRENAPGHERYFDRPSVIELDGVLKQAAPITSHVRDIPASQVRVVLHSSPDNGESIQFRGNSPNICYGAGGGNQHSVGGVVSQLPPELGLERNVNLDTSKLSTSELKVCQLFQLQALVLQLAYDNIQIILHRPFLRHNRSLLITPATHALDARPTSFEQCKHCARRTCSILPRYTQVLLAAQNTHAAAYIAMQNFTAGVTLGMVALSNPSSEQSQDAKKGVANSISLQKALAAPSIVPSQTVKVLEALFRLIFQREMQ